LFYANLVRDSITWLFHQSGLPCSGVEFSAANLNLIQSKPRDVKEWKMNVLSFRMQCKQTMKGFRWQLIGWGPRNDSLDLVTATSKRFVCVNKPNWFSFSVRWQVICWRTVPVNNSGIGEVARQCEPLMRQVFVTWENTAFTSPEDEQSFLEKVGGPFILHSRPLGRTRYDAATAEIQTPLTLDR
jgi:Glutamine amidotransferases class-II